MKSEENVEIVDRIWQEIIHQAGISLMVKLIYEDFVYYGSGGLKLLGA